MVLKSGPSSDWGELYTCEATALQLAETHGLPAPRVLGFEVNVAGDRAALLLSRIDGIAAIPRMASVERLRVLGRMAARIHRIALTPSDALPLRARHTSWTHFALWRHWSRRYRAAHESERDAVVREFVAKHPLGGMADMTGATRWSADEARETLSSTTSTPLLDAADERLLAMPVPEGPTVFVHGDLWQGNTMWDGDRCVGVIDWEVAGAGQPGVDLGCLRWDAVMLFGSWAADEVLAGWESESGRKASDVAYWDLVAVLNYPTEMARLMSTLREHGRPDLDAETLTARRDEFVRAASDRLE